MANLIDIASKMYQSERKAEASFSADFMKGVESTLGAYLKESKIKTDAFIATIPADFNMAKVPKELQGKLKAYAITAKQEYADAAALAGRLNSRDPRYQEAIDKMNSIRQGFQNNLESLAALKVYRENALNNNGNLSKSTTAAGKLMEEAIMRGDGLANMRITNEGIFLDDQNMTDLTNNLTVDTKGSAIYEELFVGVTNNATSKDAIFRKDRIMNAVTNKIGGLSDREAAAFAYDGILGDEQTGYSFIDGYIKKQNPNIEEGSQEYKQKYEELKQPGKFQTYKLDLIDHIVNSLESVHNEKVEELRKNFEDQKYQSRSSGGGGSDTYFVSFLNQRVNRQDVDGKNKSITDGKEFRGYDNAIYKPNADGTFDKLDPQSRKVIRRNMSKRAVRVANTIENYYTGKDEETITEVASIKVGDVIKADDYKATDLRENQDTPLLTGDLTVIEVTKDYYVVKDANGNKRKLRNKKPELQ